MPRCRLSSFRPIRRLPLLILALLVSADSFASAPRLSRQLFESGTQLSIVTYEIMPYVSMDQDDGGPVAVLVKEAFQAAGRNLLLDIRPSRQLAKLIFIDRSEGGILAGPYDFTTEEKDELLKEVVYLGETSTGDWPLMLYFPKGGQQSPALKQAFRQGLDQLISEGRYLHILERFLKDKDRAANRLERLLKLR